MLCDLSPLVLDPLFTVQELYLTLKARVLMGFMNISEDLGSRDCVVVVVVVLVLVLVLVLVVVVVVGCWLLLLFRVFVMM